MYTFTNDDNIISEDTSIVCREGMYQLKVMKAIRKPHMSSVGVYLTCNMENLCEIWAKKTNKRIKWTPR